MTQASTTTSLLSPSQGLMTADRQSGLDAVWAGARPSTAWLPSVGLGSSTMLGPSWVAPILLGTGAAFFHISKK